MSKANVVKIEHIEVNKRDIDKIKKIFNAKDNTEAVKRALDVVSGKIELENIFARHRGLKIKKLYA